MDTPISDFVRKYCEKDILRLHMPGHKGNCVLGVEARDITEVEGADSLYEANGIIKASEDNASALFGCPTHYSAEGSSLCIRAMLYLALLHAKKRGKRPLIATGRNAHKTFLSAVALLDLDVLWLAPEDPDSYLSCSLEPQFLARTLDSAEEYPSALYLTSPDYLGHQADLAAISEVCRKRNILLLVDNAHGAYLRFLPQSQHPIDLGADLCCDSAHKTLPVLTGGAYLHISPQADPMFTEQAKTALALFGSTSPSYLILQSLDEANLYLSQTYPSELAVFLPQVEKVKTALTEHGYSLHGSEPLKITLATKNYGYKGQEFAALLGAQNISCEFADPDYVVMMLTPQIGISGLNRLKEGLLSIQARAPITEAPPPFSLPRRVMSVREAVLSPCQTIPVQDCVGQVLAASSVGCPPAVPIVMCGEMIQKEHLGVFSYYGISSCTVISK